MIHMPCYSFASWIICIMIQLQHHESFASGFNCNIKIHLHHESFASWFNCNIRIHLYHESFASQINCIMIHFLFALWVASWIIWLISWINYIMIFICIVSCIFESYDSFHESVASWIQTQFMNNISFAFWSVWSCTYLFLSRIWPSGRFFYVEKIVS